MPPPTYPPIIFYADETEEEAAVRPRSAIAQQRALPYSQFDAGRPLEEPPDYEGMLEDVNAEVRSSFSTPADGVEKAQGGKKQKAAARVIEEAADEFEERSSDSDSEAESDEEVDDEEA